MATTRSNHKLSPAPAKGSKRTTGRATPIRKGSSRAGSTSSADAEVSTVLPRNRTRAVENQLRDHALVADFAQLESASGMRLVEKPWGHELIWAETRRYVGKVLHIKAGHKLSRQYHKRKDETFLIQSGQMDLEVGQGAALRVIRMGPKDAFHCPPGTVHRMVAVTDVDVVEVSTPELDDVVRLEDAYGRQGTSRP